MVDFHVNISDTRIKKIKSQCNQKNLESGLEALSKILPRYIYTDLKEVDTAGVIYWQN
jgi:hypothetical protein